MTGQTPADLDGLWPIPRQSCHLRPGLYRRWSGDGWTIQCVAQNGQNGKNLPNHDLYAPVPGQLTIYDALAASTEVVVAAERADQVMQALLADEDFQALGGKVVRLWDWLARAGRKTGPEGHLTVVDPKPGADEWHDGNVSKLPWAFDTLGPFANSITNCGTIAQSPALPGEEN